MKSLLEFSCEERKRKALDKEKDGDGEQCVSMSFTAMPIKTIPLPRYWIASKKVKRREDFCPAGNPES